MSVPSAFSQPARSHSRRSFLQTAGVCAVLVALAGVLLAARPAYGWDLAKSTNGVLLTRANEDTQTPSAVWVYYDYKGGAAYHPSWSIWTSASFNKSVGYVLGSTWDAFEIPLQDGYRVHLLTLGSPANKYYVVLNEPLEVSVENTPAVAVPAGVSLSSTGTVDVGTVDGLPAGYLSGLALVLVFVAGIGGAYVVTRG